MFRRAITSKNFWPLAFLIIAGVLACRTLIFQEGYFNMHDDLQMMRQLEMEKCLKDGQIPCRWVPDMGYGYGFPLFNYYPPLPYYFGQIFRVFGFSFVMTAKLNFASAIIISGITMYFFAKKLLGRKAAVLSAVFYMWAPYHAVDVFVRGAMNESWGLVWFPLILLFAYQIIVAKKNISRWVIGLAFSFAAILLSHNLMTLIFTPVLALWVAVFVLLKKEFKKLIPLALSGLWAFGLAAFFSIPVLLEENLINLERFREGYYVIEGHFASIEQLFLSRFWGYGESVWGFTNDGMSFQVGHLHWASVIAVSLLLLTTILTIAKKVSFKKSVTEKFLKDDAMVSIIFMIFVGLVSTFMIHPRSASVWRYLDFMKIIQFPWRYLSIVIFATSFVAGSIVWFLKKEMLKTAVVVVLSIFIVIFNWNYFLPNGGRMGALTDEQKFSGMAWELQQKATIQDYLPNTVLLPVISARVDPVEVMEGEGKISMISDEKSTDWVSFKINVTSPKAQVRINVHQFPDWKVYVDNVQVEDYIDDDELWGRVFFDITEGEHVVYAELTDTWPRYVGNMLTVVSLGIMVIVLFRINTKNA